MRELRKAVLNWYSFESGRSALVLGPQADLLAELLASRGLETDTAARDGRRYDYIAAVDLLERAEDTPEQLIEKVHTLLADDGVLLLCCRNRFGLKYFCGGIDDIVRTPMQGVRGEVPGMVAPAELRGLLRKAGFLDLRTYYLMPDAGFTQAVFTDACPLKDSIRDRVFPYDPYGSPFLAAEADLYDDIVREGMLLHTANAFLTECRKGPATADRRSVIYAALSTDRGEEHGFATILYSDGSACKKALWPEGKSNLQQLYDNLETLRTRGVPVIPQEMTAEGIEMPLIEDPQLMEYLRGKVASKDRDAFLSVFRQIEQDVRTSSDACDISEKEAQSLWGASAAQLGPVLETGYIDMMPYNGFFTGGRIMYYDQEFTVYRCPLRYILFRAIFYTWIHIPEAEELIRQAQVREMFGLTDLWERFFEREMRFVDENRNREKYSRLYDWTKVDRDRIRTRAGRLTEEALPARVQKVQLELLKQVDRICRENGIRYMAVHGTLLGAVRHKGFIPWDDDVDIAMLREDYEQFIRACETQLDENYFLQTPRSDPSCFYGGYAKLRDSRTSAIDYRNAGKDCNQGIWIDILPLDHCPKDAQKRTKLQKKITFWQRIRLAHLYKHWTNALGDVRGGEVSLYYILRKFIGEEKPLRKLETLLGSCRAEGYRSILAGYYGNRENRNVYTEQECRELIEMPFEDMWIFVPAAYDSMLRRRYGEDYMKIPNQKRRYGHAGIRFDPDTPFKETIRENQS